MFPIFENPVEHEKIVKEKFAIPPYLMMENAAKALFEEITYCYDLHSTALIVCGKGNNGGDGYALARLLQDWINVLVVSIEPPASEEAKIQAEMCRRLGITIYNYSESTFKSFCHKQTEEDFLIDCIYGTGFHGELSPEVKKIIDFMNASKAKKIACDIPSALYFHADKTLTMGSYKLSLFSDTAKEVSGKLELANLGITNYKFWETETSKAEKPLAADFSKLFLLEFDDIQFPFRKHRSFHKGKFGHTAVLCGDKAGAAILAASTAETFGSGLTSIIDNSETGAKTQIQSEITPLSQFKVLPSLMISKELPKKTTCISVGSGFSEFSEPAATTLIRWFENTNRPAAVLDAGMLTSPKTIQLLERLNSFENARIILTPHLGELENLLKNVIAEKDNLSKNLSKEELKNIEELIKSADTSDSCSGYTISKLAENPKIKINAGKLLNILFPKTTVVMKSANTFIANEFETLICADGAQSLAKGGCGDILAGMAAALLAQGYTAKEAAITAVQYHAFISTSLGQESYNLTPEKMLKEIAAFQKDFLKRINPFFD